VFIAYGICVLANFIIVDLTCANFISQVISSWGMIATIATQAKVISYCDQHFEDDFITLVVEIFGCLQQQMETFFYQCANRSCVTKNFRGILSILCSFYKQRILIALHRIFQFYVHFISKGS
jgi:hypothetical protein